MQKMERESFVFYRSFYEALTMLNKESQADCLMALADYALNGNEPKLTPEVRLFFTMAKPQIDANNRRMENGKKGGRPNLTETKVKPNNNLNETKHKPNVNYNYNDKDNLKDNVKENVNSNEKVNENGENRFLNRIWRENVCMQFGMKNEELTAKIDEFKAQNIIRGVEHQSQAEEIKHFVNWLGRRNEVQRQQANNEISEHDKWIMSVKREKELQERDRIEYEKARKAKEAKNDKL